MRRAVRQKVKEPHVKKRSIYSRQSQELLRIYEEAGTSKKVLVGAIDYAKEKHMVMLCNGNGDILCKPFAVENTPGGLEMLVSRVEWACRYHKIGFGHGCPLV